MRAAQAIETALLKHDLALRIQTLDFWSLMDKSVAERIKCAYLRLTQEHPALYDRIYRLDQTSWRRMLRGHESPLPDLAQALALLANTGELHEALVGCDEGRHALDRVFARLLLTLVRQRPRPRVDNMAALGTMIRWAWLSFARRLDKRVRAFRPDVVIATQMVPAALFALVKERRGLKVPFICVVTDFGIHDFWIQPGVQNYCVAHESIDGLPEADGDVSRMVPTGIPLMPEFENPPTPTAARRQLELEPREPVVLVLGGGLGLGVEPIATRLLAHWDRLHAVALLGRNSAGRELLSAKLDRYPSRLRIACDRTERIATLIRAADLVVGKPGGLTVAETLACGRPLLAARSLGGQEGFNTRFLQRHGVGELMSEAALVSRTIALLEDPHELASMQQRAQRLGRRNAAQRIAELALSCMRSPLSEETARQG